MSCSIENFYCDLKKCPCSAYAAIILCTFAAQKRWHNAASHSTLGFTHSSNYFARNTSFSVHLNLGSWAVGAIVMFSLGTCVHILWPKQSCRPDVRNRNVFSWRRNCPVNKDGSCTDGSREFQLTGPVTVKPDAREPFYNGESRSKIKFYHVTWYVDFHPDPWNGAELLMQCKWGRDLDATDKCTR